MKADDVADAVQDATRTAANSVTLARAILGDAEMARIFSKYKGRPNSKEIRALIVDDVQAAMAAHMKSVLSGGKPDKLRTYDLAPVQCRRVHKFADVLSGPPGTYTFDPDGNLVLRTPDGSLITWNITDPHTEPFFEWDGNCDAPTLATPMCITEDLTDGSVRERWQGRLVRGRLVPI